jgi:hypothetical protein
LVGKRCFKCLCEKSLELFYRHVRMKDGHLNKCIECTKKEELDRRNSNLEKHREYDRNRASLPHRVAARKAYAATPEGKAKIKSANKRWTEINVAKRNATTKLNNAVRRGKIERLPCIVCGEEAEAHHPAYSMPLEVVWLCDLHHKQVHKEARNYLRGK